MAEEIIPSSMTTTPSKEGFTTSMSLYLLLFLLPGCIFICFVIKQTMKMNVEQKHINIHNI